MLNSSRSLTPESGPVKPTDLTTRRSIASWASTNSRRSEGQRTDAVDSAERQARIMAQADRPCQMAVAAVCAPKLADCSMHLGHAHCLLPPFSAAMRARSAAPCSDRPAVSLSRPRAIVAFAKDPWNAAQVSSMSWSSSHLDSTSAAESDDLVSNASASDDRERSTRQEAVRWTPHTYLF